MIISIMVPPATEEIQSSLAILLCMYLEVIVGNFCAPSIEYQPIVSILLRTLLEQSVLIAASCAGPRIRMLSKSLTVTGCLCSRAGCFSCVVLLILEIELELGMIPENDEIENAGECGELKLEPCW